jgi:hypothetical protein
MPSLGTQAGSYERSVWRQLVGAPDRIALGTHGLGNQEDSRSTILVRRTHLGLCSSSRKEASLEAIHAYGSDSFWNMVQEVSTIFAAA